MKHFFWKLIPPRPTFAQDMTEAEAGLMQEHGAYWRGWMEKGRVAAFGLVADAAGAYGVGIVMVEDEAEIDVMASEEPTIKAGIGFTLEFRPMPRAVTRT